jgi:LAS superfamily LD-carboxypeptidase LdcB
LSGAPTFKKWLIMACVFLVMMSAIKVTLGIGKNRKAHRGEPTAQEDRIVGAAHSGKDGSGVKNEQKDSTAKSAGENEIISPGQTQNNTLGTSTEDRQKKSDYTQQDNIATIHFNIAKKFADYQLWHDALEHYRRVLGKIPDYPELLAQIAKMQFEINNQAAYQQGQALIKKGGYEEGIASMKNIDENSFYYNEAVKAIVDAEENVAQAIKGKQ